MKRLALLMAVVALALVVAVPAYAQSATSDAYAGKGGGIVGVATRVDARGSVPLVFTQQLP